MAGEIIPTNAETFPIRQNEFQKGLSQSTHRLEAGSWNNTPFISTPLLNANYPLCENSRDSLK